MLKPPIFSRRLPCKTSLEPVFIIKSLTVRFLFCLTAIQIFLFDSLLTNHSAAEQPNIILFLIDDLGWKDLGCQGSTYYRTPHIDRLANQGARFTNAYAACAVCSPTRAAILTGKYPARLLLTDWLPSGRWDPKSKLREARFLRGLPGEELTLAEALRSAGYRTANIGKWHLGSEPFSLPEHHGFDINIGGNAHGAPGSFFFPYQGDWLIPGTNLRAKWKVLPDGHPGEYLTDRLTDEAIQFITDNKKQPFFLYFPHYGVHTPLEAKPEVVAKYEQIPQEQRQGLPEYAAMVESIDDSVGRILNTLEQFQLTENTIIIFTSDNGGFWKATQHTPLRGNKGAYYEGGIRVPLIIQWPGQVKPGTIIHEPVISNDLYPTSLHAAGLPALPNQHLDGFDLTDILTARSQHLKRDTLFWHFPHYNEHPASVPCSVIRKGPWKLIETFDPQGLELYNLHEDISETNNRAELEPQKAQELLAELQAWRDTVGAEMMSENPDFDPNSKSSNKKQKKKERNQP
jgi:arylsulfatase A-like enzyme